MRNLLRAFVRQPGFHGAVLLTLGLGIGATTAVFSLLNAVVLRPFPYPEPDQLIRVKSFSPHTSGFNNNVSIPDYEDFTREANTLAATAQYVAFENVISGTGAGPAQAVYMAFVTPSLFSLLGAQPHIGRFFTDANNVRSGDTNVVVLSHALWRGRFGEDPNVIGRAIQLRGATYTVSGVMQPDFRFPDRADVWVPLMARVAAYNNPAYWNREARAYSMLARLKPGISLDDAASELRALSGELSRRFPDSNRDIEARVVSLRESEAGHLRPYVLMLTAAVLLLLLIACVNVANLMLARAAARQRETVIRAAIGASWRHIVAQLLSQSLTLSLLGGLLGCVFAYLALLWLPKLLPAGELPFWLRFDIDWRVLLLSLASAALTGILFGLAPAWQSRRLDLNDVLKEGAKGSASSGNFLRRCLVVAEVALSLTLLAAAAFMTQSFLRLQNVDLGIQRDGLVDVYVQRFVPNLTPETRDKEYSRSYRRIVAELRQIPGVASAASGGDIPVFRHPEERPIDQIHVRGEAAADVSHQLSIQGADVGPGYFATLGIPLKEGRDFREADDRSAPFVAIVSERTAAKLFPGRSAIGQQIRWGKATATNPWHTIVGVCGNTKWQATEQLPGYEMFYSYRQYAPFPNHLLLRTQVPAETLYPRIREIVRQAAPDMAVISVQTMNENLEQALWQRRLWGYLLAVFATLALILAAVGLFSVLSYLVTQRTREIGIRLALGSPVSGVRALILRDGLSLALLGCVIGIFLALATAQSLATLLLGVSSWDVPTYAFASLAMLAVAALATAIPAWRATRIDPIIALRQE